MNKRIELGCSFSPEHSDYLIRREKLPFTSMNILKFCIDELNMKEIRIGMRWNWVVKDGKNVDLTYYMPFLQFCKERDVNVCLNIGPIKSIRYPEDHIPVHIFQSDQFNKKTVLEDSEIAHFAYEYTETLLKELKEQFRNLSFVTIIQPENEPFHHFGKNKFRMSKEYLTRLVNIIHKYFPNTSILVNSFGNLSLHEVWSFLGSLRKQGYQGKLRAGFDYYYRHPGMVRLPFFGEIDTLSLSNIVRIRTAAHLRRESDKHSFEVEVTEAQFEAWDMYRSPGESLQEYEWMIERCKRLILGDAYSLIRLWGVEPFVLKALKNELSGDQDMIMKSIQSINSG